VIHVFGSCELNPARSELHRDGRLVPLAPKALEVLVYLIEHRGRVVLKTELLEELWPGENVSESSVHRTVAQLRRAIGQTETREAPIQTIYGRGYCFVDDVRTSTTAHGSDAGAFVAIPTPRPGGEPFVGRGEVMRELRAALRETSQGRGRLCVLSGEAGIGKTRCAQELGAEALSAGATVWTAYCQAADGAPAFWPWIQILRATAREDPQLAERARALLQELAPELADAAMNAVQGPALDPPAQRFRLLDAIAQLLLAAGETRTRVVILDDLQRCTETSLEVLSVLAPRLGRSRVLVLATERDDAGAQATSLRHPLLVRAPRISLVAWTDSEVEEYVEAVAGRPEVATIGRELHRKIGGNPFFVQETLRLLIARGELSAESALELDDVALPDALRQLVRAPLGELDPAARELVRVASVIGEAFTLPLLVRALGKSERDLLPLLAQALLHRIVVRGATVGEYEFRHVLIRNVVHGDIAEDARAALHRVVADAIEAQAAGTSQLGEIAYHLHQALPTGTHAKVRRYAAQAGEQAARVHAYAEAARYYRWVLDAQSFDASVSPRERCETHSRVALFELSAGDESTSRESLSRSIDIARHHGFGDLLALAAIVLRPTAMLARVEDPLALSALESAQSALPPEAQALRVRVQSHLACIPPISFAPERARALSQEALRAAHELDDPWALKDALASRLWACLDPDHLAEALALADEVVALAHGPGRRSMALDGHLGQLQVHIRRGDAAAAQRALDTYGRMAEQLRYPEARWTHQRLLAQLCDQQGRFAEADASYLALEQRGRELHIRLATRLIRRVRSRFARMRTQGARPSEATRIVTAHAYAHAFSTRFALEAGHVDVARAELERMARAGLDRLPRDDCFVATLVDLAWIVTRIGSAAQAELLYGELAPCASLNAVDELCVYTGSAAHSLGLLARVLGRHDTAVAHFEHALDMNTRLELRPFAAHTRYELASTLAEASRPPLARIRELLEDVCAEAREIGLPQLESDAESLLRGLLQARARASHRAYARERTELKPDR
jgi:eukaryotic-like serine/threonine-protein kinase